MMEIISRQEAIRILCVAPEAKANDGSWIKYIEMTTEFWLGTANSQPVVVWGLIAPSLLSFDAYLWSYTFANVAEHTFAYVRQSQIAIAETLRRFPTVRGHTDPTNAKSIKWLRWLGAKFLPLDQYGLPFVIKAHNG